MTVKNSLRFLVLLNFPLVFLWLGWKHQNKNVFDIFLSIDPSVYCIESMSLTLIPRCGWNLARNRNSNQNRRIRAPCTRPADVVVLSPPQDIRQTSWCLYKYHRINWNDIGSTGEWHCSVNWTTKWHKKKPVFLLSKRFSFYTFYLSSGAFDVTSILYIGIFEIDFVHRYFLYEVSKSIYVWRCLKYWNIQWWRAEWRKIYFWNYFYIKSSVFVYVRIHFIRRSVFTVCNGLFYKKNFTKFYFTQIILANAPM